MRQERSLLPTTWERANDIGAQNHSDSRDKMSRLGVVLWLAVGVSIVTARR